MLPARSGETPRSNRVSEAGGSARCARPPAAQFAFAVRHWANTLAPPVDTCSMPKHPFRLEAPFTKESSFATLEFKSGILSVTLTGPSVTEREATIISRELNEAFECLGNRIRVLVLMMGGVQMLSSMGLGMCIDARKNAKRLGAATVIYCLQPQIAELFRVMKVDRLYRMAGNEEELTRALAA